MLTTEKAGRTHTLSLVLFKLFDNRYRKFKLSRQASVLYWFVRNYDFWLEEGAKFLLSETSDKTELTELAKTKHFPYLWHFCGWSHHFFILQSGLGSFLENIEIQPSRDVCENSWETIYGRAVCECCFKKGDKRLDAMLDVTDCEKCIW